MSARGRGRPKRLPEAEQLEEEYDLKMDRARPEKEENTTLKEFMNDVDTLKSRARSRKRDILAKSMENSAKNEDSEKNGSLGKSVRNSLKREGSAQISEKEGQDIVVLSSTPPDSQRERWHLRSMWELAAVLNFLHVFRPVLKISLEFSAEELETALITPNNILRQLHIHLLKGIPPVSRTALVNDTWITALSKKLAVWWPWVAKGEVPLITCHGEEIEAYKQLDPGTRLLILKALCEIRLDQDDVWKYIDDSLKHGTPRSAFSKSRMGGDSHGLSYWYDGDAIIGHRLYREMQKIEVKLKPKGKGRSAEPIVTCQWETVATSFEEFQSLSEKLASSRNKLEAGIGKKIKIDILPVLEELQKKKERALKKQQRQAMLLDNFFGSQGDDAGRSRRDRKPVKYTFDDYDRSIDEAIQLTKKSRQVPEPVHRKHSTVENSRVNGNGNNPENALSSESKDRSEESDAVHVSGRLTRSNRFRPAEKKSGDNVSDNDVSNEDGVFMEAVHEDGHVSPKHRNVLSSDCEERHQEDQDEGDEESKDDDFDEESKEDDGDEEYKEDDGDEEYKEEEEDLEDDDDELSIDLDYSKDRRRHSSRRKTRRKPHYDEEESISADSEDSDDDSDDDDSEDQRRRSSRRKRKRKPAAEVQSGLRRSKRATRVDYKKYAISNSEEENSSEFEEQVKPNGRKLSVESDRSNSVDSNVENESSHNEVLVQVRDEKQPNTEEVQSCAAFTEEPVIRSWEQFGEQSLDLKNRHFIDLNEAAPFPGFDDFPDNSMAKQLGPEDVIYEQVKQKE